MARIVRDALTVSCHNCAAIVMISTKVLDDLATVELMFPPDWVPLERINHRGQINVLFRCPACVGIYGKF